MIPNQRGARALLRSSASRLLLALALVLVLSPSRAHAQIDAGSVVGTVADSQGAVLPGVTVTATQEGTGFSVTDTTNGRGQYSFPNLRIGRYSVSAELSGFKKAVRSAMQLHVQERIQANFTLDVGAMTEEVTVSGEGALLNTQTADMGYSVDAKQLTDLPLLGRRYAELALLQTGVVQAGAGVASRGEDTFFNSNGNFATWNNFVLDGGDNNSFSTNLQERSPQVIQPPVDALEEFKVQTRTYSAEFGRSAGAVINASIKQGKNNFKGVLFGFGRDEKFNSNTYENKLAGRQKGAYNQYIMGGTLGGPIKKDKYFFFVDYQATRSDRAASNLATVPTPLMRTGNLSELTRAISNTNPFVPAGCIDATTKVITPSCIDPVSLKLFNLYPQPNIASRIAVQGQPGSFGLPNYIDNGILNNKVDQYDVRLDGRPGASGKNLVFARYSYSKTSRKEPPVLGPIA
ncbi:MAG: carboxypeptidase-like regulatory domain-containing protein, partial [Vicinamibacteria bacterium]